MDKGKGERDRIRREKEGVEDGGLSLLSIIPLLSDKYLSGSIIS